MDPSAPRRDTCPRLPHGPIGPAAGRRRRLRAPCSRRLPVSTARPGTSGFESPRQARAGRDRCCLSPSKRLPPWPGPATAVPARFRRLCRGAARVLLRSVADHGRPRAGRCRRRDMARHGKLQVHVGIAGRRSQEDQAPAVAEHIARLALALRPAGGFPCRQQRDLHHATGAGSLPARPQSFLPGQRRADAHGDPRPAGQRPAGPCRTISAG
jgi:hypothetical protein